MSGQIRVRRAYDSADPADGQRVLVDRIWPRGVTKAAMQADAWARTLAPSDDLRRWYDHEPDRWAEFQVRYRRELEALDDGGRAELDDLIDRVDAGDVTLLFGARDEQRNNAVVLREVLEERAEPDSPIRHRR